MTRLTGVLDTPAIALLQRHGWQPAEILGAGMEGTVVALSATKVAKVWHGRSRADLDALVQFGSALDHADLEFDAPAVLDLLENDDLLVTIERRVYGIPLRIDGLPEPPVADEDAIRGRQTLRLVREHASQTRRQVCRASLRRVSRHDSTCPCRPGA